MSKPSQIASDVLACIEMQEPFFLKGPVGVGKSQIVFQATEILGIDFTDVRVSQMDPTDIKGFPSPDPAKNLMRWLPADFLPRKGKGLIFFDELNSAPRAVQAACYQLFLDRKVGSYALPPGWSIGAAGNRAIDRSIVNDVAAALNNRLIHMDLEPDLGDFVAYAMLKGIAAERIAFLRFRSNLLHCFDTAQNPEAFPTPRSWFKVDKIAKYCEAKKKSHADEHRLIQGAVGNAAAMEYAAFMRVVKELPTVDEIKLTPDTTVVPKSPATLHALTTSLAMATTKSGFARFMQYVSRMEKEWQVVYVRDCLQRENSIKFDPVFSKWSLENADVVI